MIPCQECDRMSHDGLCNRCTIRVEGEIKQDILQEESFWYDEDYWIEEDRHYADEGHLPWGNLEYDPYLDHDQESCFDYADYDWDFPFLYEA